MYILVQLAAKAARLTLVKTDVCVLMSFVTWTKALT